MEACRLAGVQVEPDAMHRREGDGSPSDRLTHPALQRIQAHGVRRIDSDTSEDSVPRALPDEATRPRLLSQEAGLGGVEEEKGEEGAAHREEESISGESDEPVVCVIDHAIRDGVTYYIIKRHGAW